MTPPNRSAAGGEKRSEANMAFKVFQATRKDHNHLFGEIKKFRFRIGGKSSNEYLVIHVDCVLMMTLASVISENASDPPGTPAVTVPWKKILRSIRKSDYRDVLHC